MKLSGGFHALAALLPGKKTLVPIDEADCTAVLSFKILKGAFLFTTSMSCGRDCVWPFDYGKLSSATVMYGVMA
jgi:hypothetical protein